MCTANFGGIFKKLGQLDPSRKLTEYTDTKDPLMKSLGYSGIMNPANEIKAKIDGTETAVTKKARADGLRTANKNHAASRVQGTPGHVKSIAAMKARGR